MQDLANGHLDVKALGEAANGDENTIVTTRTGNTYPSAERAINIMFQNGGLPATPFKTKALMTASALANDKYAMVTDDAANNGLYVKTAGAWVKSAYDPLTQAKAYTDTNKADTLSKVQNTFDTKALMTASPLPNGSKALVDMDTEANNGFYKKTAGAWVKSAYDPVEKSIDYIRNKLVIDLPNKFANGDFKDSTTGWTLINSEATVESEGLKVVANGNVFSGALRQSVTLNVGDTYLFRTRVKLDNNECQRLEIGASSGFEVGYTYVNDPKGGEWLYISKTLKATDSSVRFFLTQRYADAETALNKSMTVEYMSLINLSASGLLDRYDDERIAGMLSTKKADTSLSLQDTIDYNNRLINETDTKLEDFMAIEPEAPKPIIAGYEDVYYQGNLVHGHLLFNGTVDTSSPSTRFTGYLDVSNYIQIELKNFTIANHAYAFYNEDYEVVKAYSPADEGHKVNGIIPVPRDAKYFARSLNVSGKENFHSVNILGYFDKNNIDALPFKFDKLTVAEADKFEYFEDILFTSSMVLQGEFVDGEVVNVGSEYSNTGYIDVSDYDSIILAGIDNFSLDKYWLDESYNIVSKESYEVDSTKAIINGGLKKPNGAKYFRMNLKNPLGNNEGAYIGGRRRLSTADFQRKGSSGDSAQGWETSNESLTTSKSVELTNALHPDIKPLKIIHYGKALGVDYGDYINFSTEIYRLAWGMQIGMNVSKPNLPTDAYAVKDVKFANGLVAEWGVEGFSWHVSPSGRDWGKRAWMAFKIGGDSVRTQTKSPLAKGTMIQNFVPTWTERADTFGAGGWLESTNAGTIDKDMPTNTMHRHSVAFNSPDRYSVGYSDLQKSLWDRTVRSRGTFALPEPAVNGDSIHKNVFSVVTGRDGTDNPILKDVAQIEIVYADDGSDNAARIVFSTWNNVTESWEEKLSL